MEKLKNYIDDIIAPKLQSDGGWIELVTINECDNSILVYLRGECSKCQIVQKCVEWIESEIKNDLFIDIKINVERKKPFFWDM